MTSNPFSDLVRVATRDRPIDQARTVAIARREFSYTVERVYRPTGVTLAAINIVLDAGCPVTSSELGRLTGREPKQFVSILEVAERIGVVRRALGDSLAWEAA